MALLHPSAIFRLPFSFATLTLPLPFMGMCRRLVSCFSVL
jgi:hypothetical protein